MRPRTSRREAVAPVLPGTESGLTKAPSRLAYPPVQLSAQTLDEGVYVIFAHLLEKGADRALRVSIWVCGTTYDLAPPKPPHLSALRISANEDMPMIGVLNAGRYGAEEFSPLSVREVDDDCHAISPLRSVLLAVAVLIPLLKTVSGRCPLPYRLCAGTGRGWNVLLRLNEGCNFGGVPTGQPLKFPDGQHLRIDNYPTLRASVQGVHDRTLPGHRIARACVSSSVTPERESLRSVPACL